MTRLTTAVEVEGKVAVVTGAAMGIGLATAEALAEAGATVVLVDREAGAGAAAAERLGGLFVEADVTDDAALRRVFEAAEPFGGLDILVNNAGGVEGPAYPDAPLDVWQRVLEVNLRALMLSSQLALEPLRRRGGGAIVNVASVAGLGAGPHFSPEYAAAKAGVVRLTATLRSLAAEGIRVNAICPDWVDTPAVRRTLAQMTEEERAHAPELVPPQAIAGGILDLIRNDSLAGRVLVWFADGDPYLLPEEIPEPSGGVFRRGGVSYLRIPAEDPQRAAELYRAVFGWNVDVGRPDPSFEDGTGHVIGHFVDDLASAGDAGIRPYVFVERVDETLRKAVAAGAEVVTEPYPEGDLWVAVFRDPFGNVVGVWQQGPRDS